LEYQLGHIFRTNLSTMSNKNKFSVTQFLKMFESQMWCLGVDIMRAEGNLLIQYGFAHQRPPEQYRFLSSRYLIQYKSLSLYLWSFQVACYHAVGPAIVLRRQRSDILILPHARQLREVWHPDQKLSQAYPLRDEISEQVVRNIVSLGEFFVAYEEWVQALCGSAYRRVITERQPRKNHLLKRESLTDFWMKVVERDAPALVV
jgi:hypothetical protein